jgi:hypothetical protein
MLVIYLTHLTLPFTLLGVAAVDVAVLWSTKDRCSPPNRLRPIADCGGVPRPTTVHQPAAFIAPALPPRRNAPRPTSHKDMR